ncbi:MAG TPA: hypothetical protein VK711_02805 [Puia sp.]|jgi:hypothetical protein|nr:hypothetical protein [Puia sp.]
MNFRFIKTTGKLIALITVVGMISCKKDSSSSNSTNTNAATLSDSSTVADNSYADVLNNAFYGFADNSTVWNTTNLHAGKTTTFSTEHTQGVNSGNLSCAIYTLDDTIPGDYPKTLTLDFGTGCTSADGVLRTGKLTYVFSGPLLFPGTTASVTFTNYTVNGYGIQGSYNITNTSSDSTGISINTQVINGIITYPDATNYHYSHNRTYTMIAGSSTVFDISDDVYSITGNSSFSNSEGSSIVWTIASASPLIKAVNCHYISKGIVNFVYNQSVNGSIDFGDGTCDNAATITVGSISEPITLR